MRKEFNKKKVCVIGHFAFGKNLLNGQTVKTKIITKELERQLGKKEVWKIDTHGGKKTMLKLLFQTGIAMRECKNIIMLPAHNGVLFFAPLLCFGKKIFHTKIHYVVIGGWLPEFLEDKKKLRKSLKRFDYIYVETNTMKKKLEKLGFENILILPNCKQLKILKEDELVYADSEPYKLCTFSRVMKEKGIEDAINMVKKINEINNRIVYTLDIYGQIDENYVSDFEKMQSKFPSYINYKGCVDFNRSVEVLKNYFLLLFPTHFYTEGIPGTIIDGYAAGIPVVSSKWESFYDVVDDGKSGIGYEFGDKDSLKDTLLYCIDNVNIINRQKGYCLMKSQEFTIEYAMKVLFSELI